jgi:N-acyl-L-homoserine lactone synthetase
MHAARAGVFAGRRHGGPDAMAGLGPRDRYDDEHALYLMHLDSFGEIVCCGRLRPTAHGSMIAAHFGHALTPAEPVDAPATWEFSHYYTREIAGRSPSRMRAKMRLAILAAALDAGVSRIIAAVEEEYWGWVEQSGWSVRPLGPPVPYGEDATAIVYSLTVRPQDLVRFRLRLRAELLAAVGEDDQATDAADSVLTVVEGLGPAALDILSSLSRAIAFVEESEGAEAALALADSLERAVRGGVSN